MLKPYQQKVLKAALVQISEVIVAPLCLARFYAASAAVHMAGADLV